jgi:hypothetical protein
MAQEIVEFKEKKGEDTYWTNSMFGGMPGYQISARYSANLMQYVDKVVTLGLPSPANYVFLFMAGFYFLLITLRIDPKIAIIGAIAFAFSTYFLVVIEAGHNSKAHAVGYMAPVVAGIIMAYGGRLFAGAAITAVALGLELYANHLQITYYLMLLVIIFVITELYVSFKQKTLPRFVKASALLVVSALLAVSSNITNLLATQEYGKHSTRGPSELSANKENQTSGLDRDYITDWSYGVGETFSLLVPNFKGGASEPISSYNKEALKEVNSNFKQYVSGFGAYFGDQPFVLGPQYVGAIMLLFFFIGVFLVKGQIKWWLVGGTLLSLLLSWGRNFMSFTNLFLDLVPGYDKFRAVAMILVIAQFTIPLLGVFAIKAMLEEKDFYQHYKKKLMYIAGSILFITLLIAVKPDLFTSFYTTKEYDQVAESVKGQQNSQELLDSFFAEVSVARAHLVKSDAVRSLMLLIITSILIWSFLRYRYKKEYFIFSILILVMIDLITVDRRYLDSDDFVKKSANVIPFAMTQADQYIKQDTSSYRVLNLAANTFNDASTSYYHQSIGGYHGAKLKRYKELIDYNLGTDVSRLRSLLQKPDSNTEVEVARQPIINMLNTKFIIYNPDAPPLVNKGALGNAWFVFEYKLVPNADSEIVAMNYFNPKQTVIVDERFKDNLAGFNFAFDTTATISLIQYKPNHLTYKSSANAEQLAVFSEIYYDKGWNAYVDGKPADHFRANYVLRAMRVPAGQHTVEFKFEPAVVQTGEKISLAGSAMILIFAGIAFWYEYKRREEKTA